MRISVKNLGAIRQAELELGKLTIVCGSNNTGKTYVTYALFGFLDFWNKSFDLPINETFIQTLIDEGVISINIKEFAENAQEIIDKACIEYIKKLPTVYSAQEKLFENTTFQITLDEGDIKFKIEAFEQKIKPSSAKTDIFILRKEENSEELVITLLLEKESPKIPLFVLQQTIGNALKDIIFGRLFPIPFIASAERTGVAIFRKELDFARDRLLKDRLLKLEEFTYTSHWSTKQQSSYALPVETNVEFTRQLESLSKKISFLAENHNELLDNFSNIIGGEYQVSHNDGLHFVPNNSVIKLSMDESSSAVRSMLDIGFYLRHVAKNGDLLMIDEPELNLHPENQRKVSRLFARLIHCGINVFITTHSDYIIKELNTLIMLNSTKPYIQDIAKQEGYSKDELLNISDICVYIAEEGKVKLDGNKRTITCQTLIPADINEEQGIEVKSFDKTIDEMNRIQDAILFGGE